jgi:hypothetical protein
VPLVSAPPGPFDRWVAAIQGDGVVADNLRTAVELTGFVVAANEAAAGRAIDLTTERES